MNMAGPVLHIELDEKVKFCFVKFHDLCLVDAALESFIDGLSLV